MSGSKSTEDAIRVPRAAVLRLLRTVHRVASETGAGIDHQLARELVDATDELQAFADPDGTRLVR